MLAGQGTESVKEFLVAKLKETEAALKRSLDEKGLTLRQSASDQEVISFLDSRTQVLVYGNCCRNSHALTAVDQTFDYVCWQTNAHN